MPRRQSKTASEVLRELATNPEYQARLAARSAAASGRREEFRRDANGLIAELGALGVASSALETYFAEEASLSPAVVATLVRHLDQEHAPVVREAIIRSLSRSDARDALTSLKQCFVEEPSSQMRWLLANAIAAMTKLKDVGELPGISEYAGLFRRVPAKPAHAPPRGRTKPRS